jgi:uncharacterized protein GlcG (DUF336 family)
MVAPTQFEPGGVRIRRSPRRAWDTTRAALASGAVGGIDRLVIFGGGFPITIDDRIVGAIGVSGGHYSQDAVVAEAGLAAISG